MYLYVTFFLFFSLPGSFVRRRANAGNYGQKRPLAFRLRAEKKSFSMVEGKGFVYKTLFLLLVLAVFVEVQVEVGFEVLVFAPKSFHDSMV